MDLTKTFSYTLLDVIRIVSYRVSNVKPHIETVVAGTGDVLTSRILQSYDDVIREIVRVKVAPWAVRETVIAPEAAKSPTATISSGTRVTLSGDAASGHAQGTMVVIESGEESRGTYHRIESVTNSTNIDLADDWVFSALSGDTVTLLGNRVLLPADFMGLVGAYGYGHSLQYKTPRELALLKGRIMTAQSYYDYDSLGPMFCTITRQHRNATSDQQYAYYLEVHRPQVNTRGITVIYAKDFADAVDNITAPDTLVPQIPEFAMDVLIDGIVANLIAADAPERANAMDVWRNTTLADYVAEIGDEFCEDVTFIDEVSISFD